ncbi:MAG TPA: hypothetical protein VFR23_11630, partial [Jiangellaceae bacterium]|nr:hypothetical protein [Jiangellaceae bacterium]
VADLERQINELKRAMVGINGDAFADMDRQVRRLESTLKRKINVRKAFSDAGDDGASAMSAAFTSRIGPLLLKVPISLPLAAGVAGAAPVIASSVAGAVTAGVALASVGAGLAIAFQDEEVKRASAGLAAGIGEDLKDAAKPFVPATLQAIETVRRGFRTLKPVLADIFETSAARGDLQVLTEGVIAATQEIAEGFRDANANAEPLVDMLGEKLPSAGRTAGDALRIMSNDAENSADALRGLLTVAEMGVGATATLVAGLNKIGPAVAAPIFALGDLTEKEDTAAENARKLNEQAARAAAGLTGLQYVAGRTAAEIDGLNQALDEGRGDTLSAEQAYLSAQRSLLSLTATIKENGKQTKVGSDKYIQNREALLAYAGAVQNSAAATLRATGSQQAANNVLATGRQRFLAAAAAAGMEAKAAQNLANKLFAIPSPKPTITVNKQQAEAAINSINAKINTVRGRTVYIRGVVTWSNRGLVVPGGGRILERHGGIHQHAQEGLLREAQTFSPVSPARYAYAEPGTGGEAFIPRFGNRSRALNILDKAAAWHGAEVVPGGGGGGTVININVSGRGDRSDEEFARRIADKVGRIIARNGDRQARGG